MKRHLLILTIIAVTTFASGLSSCVGQLERDFPWEEPTDPSVPQKDTCRRNFLVIDFTATWCVNCPKMAAAIAELSDSCAGAIPIAVHYADEMACEASDFLVKKFDISSFPTALINLDPGLRSSVSSVDVLSSLSERSLAGSPTGCNITIESGTGDGAIDVGVTVEYLAEGTYSIGVAILEDGIVAPQVGGADQYVHDNVLRAFLQKNCNGDSLGAKQPGDRDSVNFRFNPQPQWNADALKAVVYIICESPSNTVSNAGILKL